MYIVFFIVAIIADFLPFLATTKNISHVGLNSLQTIKSNIIDDSDKEKILLANSFNMFKQSFKLMALVMFVAVCGFLLLLPSMFFKPLNYHILLDFTVTYSGLLITIISFFTYFLFKKVYGQIRLQFRRPVSS